MIIAEAGVNHNGDLDLAKRLISSAALAGADFVKFQTFKAESQVTRTASKASYQLSDNANESQYEMLRKLEISEYMHYELLRHCKTCSVGFLSTGFDISSLDLLAGMGQKIFKVPSGEITNLPYLRHIGQLGKSVILSTGMSDLDEIEAAIKTLECAGTPRNNLTVLHCTTEYPAPMGDVNLRAMLTIRDTFGVMVGYSDHTQGIEVAIAAVALGASVIEKHFTLDRNLPGPDHKASLEPSELKLMISSIRNIELALGDGVKQLAPSEIKNQIVARKSIIASCAIRAGEIFTPENIAVKRPGSGLSPMLWDLVIGKTARRNFLPDEMIDL